jgi:hypothetical protein
MSQYLGTVLSLTIRLSRVSSRCFVATRTPRFLYTASAVKTAPECRSLPIGWPNRAGVPKRPSRRWRHLVSRALIDGGAPACHPTKSDFLSDSGKVPRSKTSALPRTAPNNELTLAGMLRPYLIRAWKDFSAQVRHFDKSLSDSSYLAKFTTSIIRPCCASPCLALRTHRSRKVPLREK